MTGKESLFPFLRQAIAAMDDYIDHVLRWRGYTASASEESRLKWSARLRAQEAESQVDELRSALEAIQKITANALAGDVS